MEEAMWRDRVLGGSEKSQKNVVYRDRPGRVRAIMPSQVSVSGAAYHGVLVPEAVLANSVLVSALIKTSLYTVGPRLFVVCLHVTKHSRFFVLVCVLPGQEAAQAFFAEIQARRPVVIQSFCLELELGMRAPLRHDNHDVDDPAAFSRSAWCIYRRFIRSGKGDKPILGIVILYDFVHHSDELAADVLFVAVLM
ncbi:MAG: hypothetical protein HQ592_12330 [Planctomycetes bacterium]|nr:hypothetical protein [Planctomycetota bacterium]